MDNSLLAAFRRGDRSAVESVYWEHVDGIERFVRLRLMHAGHLSVANLADVVQEVFAKAFAPETRARYDGSRDYGGFLFIIAKNTLVDWLRRTKRHVPVRDLDRPWDPAFSSARLTDAELFDPELLQFAAEYVQRLSPELRAVHEHRFVAAEPQERAAQAIGISRQNLRTLERKLVDGLRREIRRANLGGSHVDLGPAVASRQGGKP